MLIPHPLTKNHQSGEYLYHPLPTPTWCLKQYLFSGRVKGLNGNLYQQECQCICDSERFGTNLMSLLCNNSALESLHWEPMTLAFRGCHHSNHAWRHERHQLVSKEEPSNGSWNHYHGCRLREDAVQDAALDWRSTLSCSFAASDFFRVSWFQPLSTDIFHPYNRTDWPMCWPTCFFLGVQLKFHFFEINDTFQLAPICLTNWAPTQ